MTDTEQYILQFILGDHLPKETSQFIGYTDEATSFSKYKIVIIPSGFFRKEFYGTKATLPSLPLKEIDNTPILFGTPNVTRFENTIVIYADLIASAYFLLSRYEEWVCKDIRDEHGRFPGKKSLPCRAKCIERPIVDEYGRYLRKWLRQVGCDAPEPPEKFRHINLTHDVDAPFYCRTWRSVAREILKGNFASAIKWKLGNLENDPDYSFPWLLQQDDTLQSKLGNQMCSIIFFLKAGGIDIHDKPVYNLYGKDIQALIELCETHQTIWGLHASYQASHELSQITTEKTTLEEAIGEKITHNRYHFLTSREPEDMTMLESIGITDDYTMGYADIAGFRLGTAHAVRYINPQTQKVSGTLTLHPLIMMDGTLSESKYMNLNKEQALTYCLHLLDETQRANGELSLLWHNTSATDRSGYLKDLYSKILQILAV